MQYTQETYRLPGIKHLYKLVNNIQNYAAVKMHFLLKSFFRFFY